MRLRSVVIGTAAMAALLSYRLVRRNHTSRLNTSSAIPDRRSANTSHTESHYDGQSAPNQSNSARQWRSPLALVAVSFLLSGVVLVAFNFRYLLVAGTALIAA